MLGFRSKRLLALIGVAAMLVAPVPVKYAIAANSHAGLPVSFFGDWKAGEGQDFQAILSYCDSHYGINASYTTDVSNLATELATRVQGGNAPDVASVPTQSNLVLYVKGGSVQPLTFLNKAKLLKAYGPAWINLGTVGGKLYAIYMKTDMKALVWYNPKKFAKGHWKIPKTWAQMVALSQKMVKAGLHPWTFGGGGTPPSPWTISDFFDNMYFQVAGAKKYDGLVNHTVKWTDPTVKETFVAMNQIVGNSAMIAGGRTRALSQSWDQAAKQMVDDPGAQFFSEATFVGAGLRTDLPNKKEGVDYSAFPFPQYKSNPALPVTVGVNGVFMFHNTPGARALMKCLTDPKALAQWAKRGGYLSPNTQLPLSAYPDNLTRTIAKVLNASSKVGLVRVGADDLMPPAVGGSPSGCMPVDLTKWFQNPSSYPAQMRDLESCAKRVYGH
ncbi:MAG TPA: ABC transporter substrate-binding protein [Chloroflexota bacterium]|nr:ABC transporter substrate-binding protein [Chloroflexota bacterium]